MDTYRTEEEQIEYLKKFWQDHGSKILILVGMLLFSYAAFQYYQGSKAKQIATSSALYEQLVSGLEATSEASVKEANLLHFYQQLTDNSASSSYTQYAGLLLAKYYVEQNQLDKAAEKLSAVIDNAKQPETRELAQWRLARVQLAQDNIEAAQATLAAIDAKVYASGISELQGDIAASQQDAQAAAAAYAKAIKLAQANGETVSQGLQVKADNYAEPDADMLVKAAQ